ncbi:MAG: penicillin acylase family protein [Acidobacteriaceae bacterium]|nr:penicillin acylase family protein [Acidobacteriaceae bacterium]
MISRIVRIVNVSIAVLIVLIAIAVYWYAVRPLPKTSGELIAPIAGNATIQRDARGVPHIEASSWQDAIFLQGYVTAQDRLWQMDGLRRFGAGNLAEVFGAAAVSADEHSRRMRMRAIAETDVARLTPESRAVLVEYARGVNYFIDTHRGDFSLEFSLPGHAYDPQPWTLSDSMLVGVVMFRDMTDESKFTFDKGRVLGQGADPAKVRTLFPATQGQYVSPGSNAWAVSGTHTADGKTMAANDPHLAYAIPGTWHLVHLQAPGLNVSGAALPGLPCVITGHNQQIAWGVTNLEADTLDLYVEQLDERTGRYVFQGKWEQAQLDRQFLGVRGGKPVQVDTWVTRHGPVIIQANGKAYSMRWSAADGFGFPFFDVNRAQNWQQFRAAISTFWGPPQNFIYADKAGNIGFQAAGKVPIRRDFDGDVPLDGSSGTFEWDGYIPFEQMPSIYNPPSGIVATANQDSFAPDFPYRISGDFADPYRVRQIRALLQAKNKLTVDDMLAVQKDVYSAYDHFLAQQVIAACGGIRQNDQMVRDAVDILRRWNGQMDKDEAAPMMTQLLNNTLGTTLVVSLLQPAINKAVQEKLKAQPQNSPEKTGGRPGYRIVGFAGPGIPEILPRPQVIENLLRQRPPGWVAKDDWDTWLIDNFRSALNDGRRQQGTPVSRWKWGRLLQWKFAHPVGKQLPLVDRFFDIGPAEMSGSGTTVKQTTGTLGPSERMVVDLGNLDNSVQNLPAGESGFVASRHYKDQWPAYYAGKSFPMQFDRVDAKEVLRVKPQ